MHREWLTIAFFLHITKLSAMDSATLPQRDAPVTFERLAEVSAGATSVCTPTLD